MRNAEGNTEKLPIWFNYRDGTFTAFNPLQTPRHLNATTWSAITRKLEKAYKDKLKADREQEEPFLAVIFNGCNHRLVYRTGPKTYRIAIPPERKGKGLARHRSFSSIDQLKIDESEIRYLNKMEVFLNFDLEKWGAYCRYRADARFVDDLMNRVRGFGFGKERLPEQELRDQYLEAPALKEFLEKCLLNRKSRTTRMFIQP